MLPEISCRSLTLVLFENEQKMSARVGTRAQFVLKVRRARTGQTTGVFVVVVVCSNRSCDECHWA
jgi:hypothetical protein